MMFSPSIPEVLFGASAHAGSFPVAADPQLGENSRPGSERRNRTLPPDFAAPKSQTIQRGSGYLRGRTASGPSVYLYDGENDVEEADNTGSVLARYIQGSHIDEPFAELRSGTTSYYEEDGLDAITSLTSSGGALANTYTYDSFGKLSASTGGLVNPFLYTTREFDQETSIYYYRARYYNPSLGRFISEDPIGFGGGTHFYKYARNNPVLFDDPYGLWTTTGRGAPPGDNTIICDGLGGILVQIGNGQDTSCGIGKCIYAHENRHRQDALAASPGVCRYQPTGIQVTFSNGQERQASEYAASTVELSCLAAALSKAKCDNCKKDLQNYINKVKKYRRQFE
jgi:RHS repeat-associated protein